MVTITKMADVTIHVPRLTKSMTRTDAVRRARVLAAQGKLTVIGEPHVHLDWDKPQSHHVVVFETTDL